MIKTQLLKCFNTQNIYPLSISIPRNHDDLIKLREKKFFFSVDFQLVSFAFCCASTSWKSRTGELFFNLNFYIKWNPYIHSSFFIFASIHQLHNKNIPCNWQYYYIFSNDGLMIRQCEFGSVFYAASKKKNRIQIALLQNRAYAFIKWKRIWFRNWKRMAHSNWKLEQNRMLFACKRICIRDNSLSTTLLKMGNENFKCAHFSWWYLKQKNNCLIVVNWRRCCVLHYFIIQIQSKHRCHELYMA